MEKSDGKLRDNQQLAFMRSGVRIAVHHTSGRLAHLAFNSLFHCGLGVDFGAFCGLENGPRRAAQIAR